MPRSHLNSLSAPRRGERPALTQARAMVLGYYEDEHAGLQVKPLAGLTLESFRAARSVLVSEGLVVMTRDGRYRTARSVTLVSASSLDARTLSDEAHEQPDGSTA